MTPLIDVLLVLLIIFMVITPLTPHGLDVLAPQPPPPNQPPPDPNQDRTVVIVIDKDKSLKLNQDPIEWAKLGDRLAEVFKTRAERVVFVKGDTDLSFETVAHAIDIAKGAGHRQDRSDDAENRSRANRRSELRLEENNPYA